MTTKTTARVRIAAILGLVLFAYIGIPFWQFIAILVCAFLVRTTDHMLHARGDFS